MAKERIRKTHANVRFVKERCSNVACRGFPIVEIRSWDNTTFDPPMLLCRKHWELKAQEEPPKTLKVIRFFKDLRSYL